MTTRAEAQSIVEHALRQVYGPNIDAIQIVETDTREEPWGWVFFYESRAFLRSRRFEDRLVGNAPYLVTREGRLFATGTAQPVDLYIEELQRAGQLPGDA